MFDWIVELSSVSAPDFWIPRKRLMARYAFNATKTSSAAKPNRNAILRIMLNAPSFRRTSQMIVAEEGSCARAAPAVGAVLPAARREDSSGAAVGRLSPGRANV